MADPVNDITHKLKEIQQKIIKFADHANLAHPHPKLIAVSKRQPQGKIQAALDAAHRVFGENRIQEAIEHWQHIRSKYPDLELHLIGSLQTNKVRQAVELFDVIQTVDRIKLADTISQESDRQNRFPRIYIQVNTGGEEQKGGVLIHDLGTLVEHCRTLALNLVGLMCIPPKSDDPALHFALLKKLSEKYDLPGLSMGMSNDFDLAANMGATDIRVGTAIFGERE